VTGETDWSRVDLAYDVDLRFNLVSLRQQPLREKFRRDFDRVFTF
jgi:hypothetical protein